MAARSGSATPTGTANLPERRVVVAATFRGTPGEPDAIGAEMDRIAAAREESQPLRSRTGGSTFKNPPGHKAWALIDAAGCRGLTLGGAQVSEKHCNFLLNLGSATSADIEALGEEVRRRVQENSSITLEWEIQRIGVDGMNCKDFARRRADGRLVVRARGFADQRARGRRGAARARLVQRHRGRHGPQRRAGARRNPSPTSCSMRSTARRARTARSRACWT